MIYSFTDFGSHDIYVGQMKLAMVRYAPNVQMLDLLHDAPSFDVFSSAHLLSAMVSSLPTISGDVFLTVVDPGVGGERRPVVMRADDLWFVGPDNGLLSVVAQRARKCEIWEITWRPERLSASFHGRDLFAPIAAKLAMDGLNTELFQRVDQLRVMLDGQDAHRIIYIDHYGNAMTGIRASLLKHNAIVHVQGKTLTNAHVFCDAAQGGAFWYENSLGLLEIAINGGSAAERFNLTVGLPVDLTNGQ